MEPKLATQDPARDDTDPLAVAPGEGPGAEATVLHRPAANEVMQPARLVVLAGPRTGLEVPVTEHEVSIGRGPENLVVLPDISVSRHHAMLRRENGRYVLLDQASGNGTRLNGKPVTRSPLRSGDRIAFGDSLVEFFDPDEGTARSAAAPRASRSSSDAAREGLSRRAIYYLAAGATVAVFFAVAGWRKHERDLARSLSAQQAAETRALAGERFAEARTMLGEGRWNEALAKLRIAAELNPRDREITRYVKKADDEAPHAAALAEARAALGRKDFAAAQTALSQVPDDSLLAESVRDLRAALAQAMDEAVRDARKKAEANDPAAASERLAPVLAADPGRADAVAVRDALSREPAGTPARRRSQAAASGSPPAPRSAIERAYLGGDLAAAIELAEHDKKAPRAARALRDLRGFEGAYREGFAQLQAGKVREAASALDRANAFDRAIAGRVQGPLGARVRKALSSLHTEMALELTETAELPKAAAQLRAAIAEDPSNERAQKELLAAMGRAHEEYMRGYVAKDSDPDLARVSFRIAAETLPPSDDEGQKARRWLDKLSGGSTPRESE
jgi:pSer/pThr/pTyr-binding forkhead associated (FHA) protein